MPPISGCVTKKQILCNIQILHSEQLPFSELHKNFVIDLQDVQEDNVFNPKGACHALLKLMKNMHVSLTVCHIRKHRKNLMTLFAI